MRHQFKNARVNSSRYFGIKSLILLISISVNGIIANAQEQGDIAIIGLHSDIPDQFAWVTLIDLDPGQVLYFTDQGYIGNSLQGSRTVTDGTMSYTVPEEGLRAGSVQIRNFGDPLPQEYRRVDTGDGAGTLLLGKFGDQLTVYTGSPGDPDQYLFAVNTNASRWGTTSPEPNFVTETNLYPGLTNNINAVAVGAGPVPGEEFDNCYYTGPSTGTINQLKGALANPANWDCTDDPIPDITNGTLASGFEITTEQEEVTFRRGDVNEDNAADITDVVNILAYQFLGTFNLLCLDSGDVNDDGVLDVSDPLALLSHQFLGTDPPPSPYGVCGPDPTPDDLDCGAYPDCDS